MQSSPVPADEAARLHALRAIGLLDTPDDPAFDNLVKLATCPKA